MQSIPLFLDITKIVDFRWKKCQRPATLLGKRLWHSCFLVNFAKLLRTPFITEHLGRKVL